MYISIQWHVWIESCLEPKQLVQRMVDSSEAYQYIYSSRFVVLFVSDFVMSDI